MNWKIIDMPVIGIVETKSIIRAIKQKYGYDFSHYSLSAFRQALDLPIIAHHLKYPELLATRILEDEEFFDEFLFEITSTSLELFRDYETWNLLKSDILPKFFKTLKKPKIWFPSLSNGQDLFSFLILLKTFCPDKTVTIEASSLSDKILQNISHGKISPKQIESGLDNLEKVIPDAEINSFLKTIGKFLFFDLTSFQKFNLVKQNPDFEPVPEKLNMIFLRNILLTYTQDYKFTILDRIMSVLEPGGILITGIKENIDDYISARQNLQVINTKEKVYSKIN
jgi:chemotaxis protein methyltransferase CheR